jgi:cysteine desulfurase family protein (TIGR01976 family)
MENAIDNPDFALAWCRQQFPALSRSVAGRPAVFFDGPGGSQVPTRVVDAMTRYLLHTNANHGGVFETSRQSDALMLKAQQVVADLLGTADPETVVFGPNMTSMTFALSRALAQGWQPGDEVLVTDLSHDANITPWLLAARDSGATVRHVAVRRDDCTLDMDDFMQQLSPRTKLVAISAASNAVGTINPVEQLTRLAHDRGALVFVDAVHYAPHHLLDVGRWGCDFVACSAYKFFGPHVGILWGRRDLLTSLPAYKVRPAPDAIPTRWMTGTPCFEGIAGAMEAVEYLADLGRQLAPAATTRRSAIEAAYGGIVAYERELTKIFLGGLAKLSPLKVWGITDPSKIASRVPTISITHPDLSAREIAERLASQGIFTWHGHFYAMTLAEVLGLKAEGLLRIGFLHYNTREEVDRTLAALAQIV